MSLYLNLAEEEINKPIYRIVSYERLIRLFKNKENGLVHPSMWEDPFENFILRSKVRSITGEITEYHYHENFYGQCWTLHKASDAMWRIYSKDNYGVRIKTTIKKLLTSCYYGGAKKPDMSCVIGKVQYLSFEKLQNFADGIYVNKTVEKDNLFKTLLVKRLAFEHEREIRLLYFDLDKREKTKVFTHSINPHDLIEQIMVDPRLPKEEAETYINKIRKNTGFTDGIKRSLLYEAPRNIIIKERA